MTTETKEKKKMIFKDKKNCTVISKCNSIKRITKCLHFYLMLEVNDYGALLEYLNENNYPFLLDDYHHILQRHLGDSKSIQHSNEQYEEIHNYIMQYLKECKLEKCNKLSRNNRNRETQSINAKQNDTNDDTSINDKECEPGGLLEFYIETLDTIHCLLVHAFDVGFRLRSDEIDANVMISLERMNSTENDDEVCFRKISKYSSSGLSNSIFVSCSSWVLYIYTVQ